MPAHVQLCQLDELFLVTPLTPLSDISIHFVEQLQVFTRLFPIHSAT
jgi:hypothetical protein